MIVYPAIDLFEGHCVRLMQGDYNQVTTFDGEPLDMAHRWKDEGAAWLHIIDLEGAREGHPVHLELVKRIADEVRLPIRLGGGLRTIDDVNAAFDAGVQTIFLGTAALDVSLLDSLLSMWGERIEVALDRRGDELAVNGWQTAAGSVSEWTRCAVQAGVRAFLVTDIHRDGGLGGVNIDLIAQTHADAGKIPIRVAVAGGIATVNDIRSLARAGADGAVIGRALYTGSIKLADALAAAREETTC
jgi:phosphoribosylformimino-5-aminoimidazole carboxamide ribotide isomerase